MCDEYQEG